MDVDFWIFVSLRKVRGKLRRLDERAMGNVFASGIAHDDMRAGIVRRVQPEIVWLGDFEREVVVIARRPAN